MIFLVLAGLISPSKKFLRTYILIDIAINNSYFIRTYSGNPQAVKVSTAEPNETTSTPTQAPPLDP